MVHIEKGKRKKIEFSCDPVVLISVGPLYVIVKESYPKKSRLCMKFFRQGSALPPPPFFWKLWIL